MNNPTISGVRYIGKKYRQEDTVCKTGAVWKPGHVHNFSEDIAKRLLVHTDSFERADISMTGGTFMSRGGDAGRAKNHDVAAFVNLTGMNAAQLAHFASLNFGRQIDTSKGEEQIRQDVHTLMINANLDEEALRRESETKNDGRVPVPYMASREEYEALQAGTVRLAIVPAEVDYTSAQETGAEDVKQDPEAGNKGADLSAATDKLAPTLDELLTSLEKPDLIAFAKQENVPISNTMTAEKLREKIKAVLSERATAAV